MHLSSARVTVERASGVLKGWFRILMKGMNVDLDNVVKTIITCYVLHNICQKRGHLYIVNDEVLENVLISDCLMRGRHDNNQNYPGADALRDVLAKYMFGNILKSMIYNKMYFHILKQTHVIITCSKSTIETGKQGVNYVKM